jgi:hypothetical protein
LGRGRARPLTHIRAVKQPTSGLPLRFQSGHASRHAQLCLCAFGRVQDDVLFVTAQAGVTQPELKGKQLLLPPALSSETLRTLLEPFISPEVRVRSVCLRKAHACPCQHVAVTHVRNPNLQGKPAPKRLHVTNPRSVFNHWADGNVALAWQQALDAIVVKWCCRFDKASRAARAGWRMRVPFSGAAVTTCTPGLL